MQFHVCLEQQEEPQTRPQVQLRRRPLLLPAGCGVGTGVGSSGPRPSEPGQNAEAAAALKPHEHFSSVLAITVGQQGMSCCCRLTPAMPWASAASTASTARPSCCSYRWNAGSASVA